MATSSSEGPPEPRGQRGAARAWWHTTSQRRGNFGATRTTPTPSAPSTSFDVKRSGGAIHKPHLRNCPASARGGELAFRSSKGPVHSAASLGGGGTRWVGDVYFLLDGGMAHTSLHKAFQSKDKVSKSLTVLKDVISVDSKHEHMLISGRRRPC